MSSEDDELLRRFAALRAPPAEEPTPKLINEPSHQAVIDEQARKAAVEDDELNAIAEGRAFAGPSTLRPRRDDNDRDLQRRFGQLTGREVDEAEDGEMRDDEVEAFLSSLSAPKTATDESDRPQCSDAKIRLVSTSMMDRLIFGDQPLDSSTTTTRKTSFGVSGSPAHRSPDTPSVDHQRRLLSREASEVLRAAKPYVSDAEEQGESREVEDIETEEEILARALAEAELDQDISPALEQRIPSSPPAQIPDPPPTNDVNDTGLAFPSLPSHQPEPFEDDGDDEQAREMMSRLMGLSGPAQLPGSAKLPSPPKREVGKGWNLPGYDDNRDEDLESWCCICNKDAILVCLGCDGDAYCRECWDEGHGEGGERGHRVKTLVWRGKRAMGA